MNKINFLKLLILSLCLTLITKSLHAMDNPTAVDRQPIRTPLKKIIASINELMDMPIVTDRDIEDISVIIPPIETLSACQTGQLFQCILEENSLILIKGNNHYQIIHFTESRENPYPAPII